MNPRVIAWARIRSIDPEKLVRKDQTEDVFQVDGLSWIVPFVQWNEGKRREWRALCPHPGSMTCADHCFNHEAYNAWLQEESS
jgi:hypothetical protein